MSLGGLWYTRVGMGFPRVSGDEPLGMTWNATQTAFSPRERG